MRMRGRYAHARHILVGSKAEAQAILNEITNARKPLKMFKKWLEIIPNVLLQKRKETWESSMKGRWIRLSQNKFGRKSWNNVIASSKPGLLPPDLGAFSR